MTTYQKAIQILGKGEVERILKDAIFRKECNICLKYEGIDQFRPWIEKIWIEHPLGLSHKFKNIPGRYMTVDDIKSSSMVRRIVAVRHIMFYYFKESTNKPYRHISRMVRPSDHSTVINSIAVVNDMIATKDPEYMELLHSLKTFCAENQIFTINL